MDYFNKFKSKVQQVQVAVNNALPLPGNPISREYEILDAVATAGPGLFWTIYKGRKYTTNAPCSVWIFEKRKIEKWPKYEKDLFQETLKQGVSNLTRLRHPRLLVVEHSLMESRESFAFCTEPVFSSLANVLGKTGDIDKVPADVENFELLDVDIRHGLFQLAEALAFLHIDGKMLHRNISPEAVVINEKGAWKLAGFDFSIQGAVGSSGKPSFDMLEWDNRTMAVVQPMLDYMAPEYVVGGRCDMYADIYSLGVLSFAIFNKGKPPFPHDNNLENFRKNAEQLKHLQPNLFASVPPEFRDDVKMCLNFTPDLRPDATQFSKIVYFDDILTKTLNYFDSLMQMDNAQKMQFFKGLPAVLEKFPKRPLLQKVMPYLAGEFGTADLIPFILPSVFLIAEQTTNEEFEKTVLPHLIPIFPMDRPYQIVLLLLQKMELLLQKTPEHQLKAHVLPLIYTAIGSETIKVQELCLTIIPSIGNLVDRNAMKNQLLPKLLKLATDGNVLSVKVQTLVCLGKLMPALEPWMITEQIVPTLPKINSKEPGILMAILGIYKLAFEMENSSLTREQLAKSVLPFLMATCIENTLNLPQFEQYMVLIKKLLAKVESDQRSRLQQLSAGQEEQRNMKDFSLVLEQKEFTKSVERNFDGLVDVPSNRNSVYGGSTPTNGAISKGPLTLEEKKRLAAEQEANRKLRTQPQLMNSENANRSAPSLNSMASASQQKASPAIDLSSFLPPPTASAPVARPSSTSGSNLTFPNTSVFNPASSSSSTGLDDLFSSHTISGPVPQKLSQPPSISNPVNRLTSAKPSGSGMDLSSFDSLISFPSSSSGQQPSRTSKGPSMNAMLSSSSKPTPKQRDPFDDLLG